MTARMKVALALLVVAGAAVAGVLVTRGGASRDTAKLSNDGGPTIAMRGLRMKLATIRTGHVLAVRHGRALYRLELAGGAPCFGAGSASQIGTPGSVICPKGGFPSGGSPVVDFSVYENTQHELREFSLFRVEGVAADGVAAIQFFRPNGDVALTVPVSANVYSAADVPKGPVAGYAAIDKDGRRIWRSP
jgi:hypothetical protein